MNQDDDSMLKASCVLGGSVIAVGAFVGRDTPASV